MSMEAEVPWHCGGACPFEMRVEECPQEHWCDCCGDCLYCDAGIPCYDIDKCGITH